MRILRSVIQALVPPVLDRGHHLTLGGAVARQLVRDQDTRGSALLFQQLAEQALGGSFVPPLLDDFQSIRSRTASAACRSGRPSANCRTVTRARRQGEYAG